MFKIPFQKYALVVCSALAFTTINTPLTSQQATLNEATIDFTQVAKKAIPAVVSIKVTFKGKKKSAPQPSEDDDDARNPFSDDFFKKFFGVPLPKDEENEKSKQEPTKGQASGFIVSPDGLVLTNSHVVNEAEELLIVFTDGREFTGKLVGQDPNTDVAVVKIDAKDLPFLTFANSDELQVGQWAIAIGNPLGLQATLTVGVVSATGRNNLDLEQVEDFIQTDAAINRGNSGGPLLNLQGEVIGMNTAIFTNSTSGGYMGIGFAIPSNLLKRIMDELMATGKVMRGYIGVEMQQMDSNLAKAFNLDRSEGALVVEVIKNSPADKAGLKQGDIVLKYNNKPVSNIASLRNSIALTKPGARITLSVLREGKTIDLPVEIGVFPSSEKEQKPVADVKENKFGFGVQELSPEIAQSLGYRDDKGVIISKVDPSSPAALAGLKKGTLIIAINQMKVTSVDEFNKALENAPKGKPLLLLVKQGGSVRFISLQIN